MISNKRSSMTQIALIRTGSTDYDEQGRIAGTLDIPLCHNGAGQVARMVEELAPLPISVVYSSPDQASQQTADAIAVAKGTKTKRLDKLQNINMGLWQGKLIEDVRQTQKKVYRKWQEQPETVCPPEGETLAEATSRIASSLKKVAKNGDGSVVALVAPQPLCSLVRSVLTDEEIGNLWAAESDCGSWELIETKVTA